MRERSQLNIVDSEIFGETINTLSVDEISQVIRFVGVDTI